MRGEPSELVERAARAQPDVERLDLDERLARAAVSRERLADAGAALVESAVAEAGQPRRFAERELQSALGLLDELPRLADAIRPRAVPAVSGDTRLDWCPYGVVFGWHSANSPVWVPTVVVMSALIGGNAVVSRPSQRAIETGRQVIAALGDPWPVDAVVLADLTGAEAEPLVWAPGVDAVVAHSSTTTCKRHLAGLGRAYAEGGRLRPYIPEASGNDAFIVLADADVDAAARAAAVGGFANGGQLCMAAKRILVEESAWERFGPALRAAVEGLRVGPPEDSRTDVAPLRQGTALDQARRALAEALARGGVIEVGRGEQGRHFTPTVVRLPPDALDIELWREEIFAPLRGLIVVPDADRAIGLANDSPFGLGAAVFGGDGALAGRLRFARVLHNEGPLYQDAQLVVGGVRDSGLGGARPKIEQLVWPRRIHRAGG